MVELSPSISRRGLLAGGVTALTALAGCSAFSINDNTDLESTSEPPLKRIVVRSDTGNTEPVRLTLAYGSREGHTDRPVWTTVDAPADGEPVTAVQTLDTGAGVYSLTAASKRHANHEVVSFNSLARSESDTYQFEVVVKHTGDVWTNLNEAGQPVSIPGYNR